jgi:hypothetical protein
MFEFIKNNQTVFIIVLVVLVFLCYKNNIFENFVPLWSASHHNGFNVYDGSTMVGGRVYNSSNNLLDQQGCRDSCKKRWGSEYKKCNAYNYNNSSKKCDLIEYDGSDGGGILPQEEDGMSGGYNYNNQYMPHNYYQHP